MNGTTAKPGRGAFRLASTSARVPSLGRLLARIAFTPFFEKSSISVPTG